MTVEERLAGAAAAQAGNVLAQHGLDELRHLSAGRRATRPGNTTGRSPICAAPTTSSSATPSATSSASCKLLGEGHGTKFEHECYDVGHLYNLAHFVDRGLFKPPFFLQMIFGILGGIGARHRQPDVHEAHRRPAVRRRLSAGRCWPPAATRCRFCHPGRDDGRQCARRAGGLALYRPRQARDEQRRAGRARSAASSRNSATRSRRRRRRAQMLGLKGADRTKF